jgi:hypothetical protein
MGEFKSKTQVASKTQRRRVCRGYRLPGRGPTIRNAGAANVGGAPGADGDVLAQAPSPDRDKISRRDVRTRTSTSIRHACSASLINFNRFQLIDLN